MNLLSIAKKESLARYSSVFISAFLLVIISIARSHSYVISIILFSFVSISGLFLASSRKIETFIALIIAVPWLLFSWISIIFNYDIISKDISGMIMVGYLSFIIFIIIRHLAYAKKVSADLLFGAASVYLMLGILFAEIYSLIIMYNSNALTMPANYGAGFDTLIYFSFTTLTTLGYGDVLPAIHSTKAVAITESIFGVLYTAIIVARLMGLYIGTISAEKQINSIKNKCD